MRTRVKICGLRQPSDVCAAVAAGVDALGFVFYAPSPRAVDTSLAAQLTKNVPSFVTNVGLLVNAEVTTVEQILTHTRIQLLQFHGDESPEFCEQFKVPFIKAVRMQADTNLYALRERYAGAAGLLLDAYQAGVPGGTGAQFNWDLIPTDIRHDIILAGGLDAANVGMAINTIHPYAVDVSGGVEPLENPAKGEKRKKDHARIGAFMQAVRSTY